MAPDAALVVLEEYDGDIIVCVTNNGGREQTEVQFCASGGKSPNTRRALVWLMQAMQDDLDEIILGIESSTDTAAMIAWLKSAVTEINNLQKHYNNALGLNCSQNAVAMGIESLLKDMKP